MIDWLVDPLTGTKVLLRAPALGDEPALIEMATDPRVCRYLKGPVEPSVARDYASRRIEAPGWGTFVVVALDTREVAGQGSIERKRGPWEVSYKFRYSYWGRGLASEAVDLIRGWFFEHTGEDLLIATTQKANLRSRRLLSRVGATFTGTFTQYGLPQERYEFKRTSARDD
ncbi:GNAT family N-acetyltransferase [Actinoplanes derwentensis]|uniref:Protein N-acetyltransferase, RimJ/RimL family n=1 Tax=Actinoplanes derwentensis TaxID=113562 RepID=A0A1H2CVA8_9ACTN|nr:GNAT family N-acetyltransferase [Actinoplanes derwentensis]GID82038.1 N-acetyltransferase [Actinoplanes derwentensis]SDT74435.1 Protein N-acetyltransferase, RimJ/RimL family [Actinoplanes derwentensis]